MSFGLEEIDELRKRANVSYEDAKDALEKCNGDMLEALIYLEKQSKVKPDQCSGFMNKIKRIINKGNNTRFIVRKGERTVISLPVTIVIIITVFAPYITLFGILIALVTGHRFKFEGKNGEDMKVNETLNKVSEVVDNAKKKLAEDSENKVTTVNQ